MTHHDDPSWFTMMHHDDSSWWIMMTHHAESWWFTWCAIMMHHDHSLWWIIIIIIIIMTTHQDDSSWWTMMIHHDVSWWNFSKPRPSKWEFQQPRHLHHHKDRLSAHPQLLETDIFRAPDYGSMGGRGSGRSMRQILFRQNLFRNPYLFKGYPLHKYACLLVERIPWSSNKICHEIHSVVIHSKITPASTPNMSWCTTG